MRCRSELARDLLSPASRLPTPASLFLFPRLRRFVGHRLVGVDRGGGIAPQRQVVAAPVARVLDVGVQLGVFGVQHQTVERGIGDVLRFYAQGFGQSGDG